MWWSSVGFVATVAASQLLPPVQWTNNNSSIPGFSVLNATRTIYIDRAFAKHSDTDGLTLIPPTALEFAETFRQDLSQLSDSNWTLKQVDQFPDSGIFLGRYRGNASHLVYEDGLVTEEGYELEIKEMSIFIGGTGARGMFWGTRTLLQRLLVSNRSSLPLGIVIDAPAYATRGYMLDAGRKWYAPAFLKELCTYASFFKMSEFHYHSSDNYPLNRGHNDTWQDVFSHFSLYPESPDLKGIIERKNETLSRADFEDFQRHCVQRGITVVPEIEAPGHCLAITKWKPELALSPKDLLNLTHPDSIPTVKKLWAEFLPWFQTKEVHIGADEYDAALANDYINFVNEMSDFINSTSGKRARIWGTNEPSENLTISKNVIIQHWQYGQSDPVQLSENGYSLINSEDWWAYISLKNDHTPVLPAPYPQSFNVTRTLDFANMPNWQWEPALFNAINITEQLPPSASGNKGAILAAWNDNGPDATTQLEAYYAIREGIPLMAARAWSGARGVKVNASALSSTVNFLASNAPGQNLDRRMSGLQIPPNASPLILWSQQAFKPINFTQAEGSYGPPYTLTLNITGPFSLSGPDTTLSYQTISTDKMNISTLVFTTNDNFPYPLRSVSITDGHDHGALGRIFTNVSTSSHVPVPITLPAEVRLETDVVNGTRVWVNGTFKGRFEVYVFGGKNTLYSWSQMAFVAPLQTVQGKLEGLVLEAGTGKYEGAGNNQTVNPPVNSGGRSISTSGSLVDVTTAVCLAWLLKGLR